MADASGGGVRACVDSGGVAEDPYAHLEDNAWREPAEIDRRFERGAIDEDGWHDEVASLVVPAYLAAETPWGQWASPEA